jgi:hypothetical protein
LICCTTQSASTSFLACLGGLRHHGTLVDQPQLLVLDREPDGPDLLEVLLHRPADLLELRRVRLADLRDLRACASDGVELVLEELALDVTFPGHHVARVELSVRRVPTVVAVHHRLHQQRSVLLVLVGDGEQVADALQAHLELGARICEETRGQELEQPGHALAPALRVGGGAQLRVELLHRLFQVVVVLRPALDFGDHRLDLEVALDEELGLVPGEVLPDPLDEARKRLLREAVVVQRRKGGDDEVRADDDLHQHGVGGIAEGLAGALCQTGEPRCEGLHHLEIAEPRGHLRIDDESR